MSNFSKACLLASSILLSSSIAVAEGIAGGVAELAVMGIAEDAAYIAQNADGSNIKSAASSKVISAQNAVASASPTGSNEGTVANAVVSSTQLTGTNEAIAASAATSAYQAQAIRTNTPVRSNNN